jgi:hypothetical protein
MTRKVLEQDQGRDVVVDFIESAAESAERRAELAEQAERAEEVARSLAAMR